MSADPTNRPSAKEALEALDKPQSVAMTEEDDPTDGELNGMQPEPMIEGVGTARADGIEPQNGVVMNDQNDVGIQVTMSYETEDRSPSPLGMHV